MDFGEGATEMGAWSVAEQATTVDVSLEAVNQILEVTQRSIRAKLKPASGLHGLGLAEADGDSSELEDSGDEDAQSEHQFADGHLQLARSTIFDP